MNASGFRPSLHQITAGIIALLSAGTVTYLQWTKLQALEETKPQTHQAYLREEKQIETNIRLLGKLPSMGFDNLVANWAFLSFVQYFGDDQARSSTGYSVNPEFFEVIVDRDPNFLDMYPMLSSTITLFSGAPVKSIELIDQGLTNIPEELQPEAYFLWQVKATDELLFLGKPKAAEKSYRMAAEWASRSEDEETQAIGTRALQTAEFLAKNPNSRSAQVASWFNVLSSALDDRTRSRAIQQIQQLGGTVDFTDGAVKISFPED